MSVVDDIEYDKLRAQLKEVRASLDVHIELESRCRAKLAEVEKERDSFFNELATARSNWLLKEKTMSDRISDYEILASLIQKWSGNPCLRGGYFPQHEIDCAWLLSCALYKKNT